MIYICIPTYNEERTIGVVLWKIRQVMAEFPRDYQILVKDDASTDATPEILSPYTRILPLSVFRNEERKGYAASLEMLLREAVRRSSYPKRDIIVTLQADFTDEPDEIPTLVKRIEGGADVVASEVTLGLELAPRPLRWARRVLGYLLRRLKWPAEVSDPLSGFRAYRLITIRKALEARGDRPLLEWDGWAANAALLRAVVPFARRVEETPVTIRYDRRRRPTRFRALDAGRDVVRFMRTGAGRNGHGPPQKRTRPERGASTRRPGAAAGHAGKTAESTAAAATGSAPAAESTPAATSAPAESSGRGRTPRSGGARGRRTRGGESQSGAPTSGGPRSRGRRGGRGRGGAKDAAADGAGSGADRSDPESSGTEKSKE